MNNILFMLLLFMANPVRVGTAGSAPFVVDNDQGISVELWEEIAKKKEIDYQIIKHYESVDEALQAINHNELDVVVGPLSITSERESKSGPFTQPYFQAKMGILAHRSESFLSKLKPFFNGTFFFGLFVFLLLLFGVGTIVWLVEKRKNLDFAIGPSGIVEGAWFAIVTMTTVGYGDKSPRTHIGRALTAVWMLVGIILFSTFTAFLTNALDASNDDLGNILGKRVAVVRGSTGENFARHRGAKLLIVESLDDAINNLDSKKVDGIVFDGPALQYHIKNNPSSMLRIYLYNESSENYGFISNIDINADLLEMKENGQIQAIKDRWLSDI